MTKRTSLYALLAVATVGVAAIAGYYFWPRSPTIVADRLCEYIRDQQKMNCVATLASDTFVHPGSIVSYRPSETPANDRLDLPVADITGSSCLVPGAEALADASKAPAGVSIPSGLTPTLGTLVNERR